MHTTHSFILFFKVISRVLFLDAGVEINIIKQQILMELMLSFSRLDDIYGTGVCRLSRKTVILIAVNFSLVRNVKHF